MNEKEMIIDVPDLDQKKMDDITDILVEIPWTCYCSMNLPYGCEYPTAIKLIEKWQDTLFTTNTIQIGCAGIFDPIPHPHLHMFAIGSSDRMAMLTKEEIPIAQDCWGSITQQSIFITPICCEVFRMRVFAYILLRNTPSGLSVPFSADFKGQLQGMGPYDEELFGPLDSDDGDAYEKHVEKLREFVAFLWVMADDPKILI